MTDPLLNNGIIKNMCACVNLWLTGVVEVGLAVLLLGYPHVKVLLVLHEMQWATVFSQLLIKIVDGFIQYGFNTCMTHDLTLNLR